VLLFGSVFAALIRAGSAIPSAGRHLGPFDLTN
jgi:hypothetical protein